jgi:predicted AlkP superfamily pyrophosphatase or phosphodiesterase
MRSLTAALAAPLVVVGCLSTPAAAATTTPPRLVVFVAIDGFPQRQVVDYRDQLAPDGLRRFLDRGAWFSAAHYGHSLTVTGPGHAVMLTGAYPHRTGIIDNQWRNPVSGKVENCVGDPAHAFIGQRTGALDGTSPRNLRAETVGDVLRAADARSKVVSVSIKDRGAILPAGKLGTAYIYQGDTGQFASSTYYMKAHPAWVDAFNARHPADRYFGSEWKPLLPREAYAKSPEDGQAWHEKGGALPKRIGVAPGNPGTRFYAELVATPYSDELTLDFARAALAGEHLGADDAPDLLIVSLSGHDSVNHQWGAESRISHDHVLRLDRALQAFFGDLDAAVGEDGYLAVLTADHGFAPAPELSRALGRDAGRFSVPAAIQAIDAALVQRFGAGRWIARASTDTLAVNRVLARERGVEVDAVTEEARRLLLAQPAVAAAYTRRELESGNRSGAPYFEQVERSWHREISGDVEMVLKPYWIYSSGRTGTTHGSPHPYDTQVPILLYGPRWVKPGRFDARVEVADIAPTLARLLGVRAPSSAEGRPLPLGAPGA